MIDFDEMDKKLDVLLESETEESVRNFFNNLRHNKRYFCVICGFPLERLDDILGFCQCQNDECKESFRIRRLSDNTINVNSIQTLFLVEPENE